MRMLSTFFVFAAVASPCFAQLPEFYKHVNRVTWLVRSLDGPLAGGTQLGLSEIYKTGNLTLEGKYRDKPLSMQVTAVSGSLGNLTIDMIQPAAGDNAFNDFLARHGDGIFSIVHEVSSMDEMSKEIERMQGLGVSVLQQFTVKEPSGPVTVTYFDTEPRGKYVLGLIHWPGGAPPAGQPGKVSHIALVVRDSEGPSAFWQKLGFPAMPKSHASPREDSRYHGKPLWLDFDVAWQRHTQFTYEWIIPPNVPPNLYAEFLKQHGEGIQHLGLPADDLQKTIADYEKSGYSAAQSGAWGDIGKKGSGQYSYMDTDAIGGVIAEVIHPYN